MNELAITGIELHRLSIPFIMNFSHATATRSACDSFLWVVSSGSHTGYGEAVFRDYVSGSIDGDPLTEAAEATRRFCAEHLGGRASLEALRDLARDESVPTELLPVLCGLETAILDLLCGADSTDIYGLLGIEPLRNTLTYGGTVPLLDHSGAERILGMYRKLGIPNLRIKVGKDAGLVAETIGLARRMLGDDFDLRVDANGAWTREEALALIPVVTGFGIDVIEEPVGRNFDLQAELAETFPEVTFAADESALTGNDIKSMQSAGTFDMINIRLSKNGGLLRSLSLAELADRQGLTYQLGCHVGETGILSATGRAAATLMTSPRFVDGSYDAYLLSDNITDEHVSFGPGGTAEPIRDRGLGFRVEPTKIERFSVERKTCI